MRSNQRRADRVKTAKIPLKQAEVLGRGINSVKDIVDLSAALWLDLVEGRVAPQASRGALEVGNFMLEAVRTGIQLKVGKFQPVLGYISDLQALEERAPYVLTAGFSVDDVARHDGISVEDAQTRLDALVRTNQICVADTPEGARYRIA